MIGHPQDIYPEYGGSHELSSASITAESVASSHPSLPDRRALHKPQEVPPVPEEETLVDLVNFEPTDEEIRQAEHWIRELLGPDNITSF